MKTEDKTFISSGISIKMAAVGVMLLHWCSLNCQMMWHDRFKKEKTNVCQEK